MYVELYSESDRKFKLQNTVVHWLGTEHVSGAERADLPLRRSSPFCCIPLHAPLHAPAILQRPLTAPLSSNQFSSRSALMQMLA